VTAGAASAQTVVTVCGRDDAAGGTNLAAALAVGGPIVVRCGTGPQTIQITQTHALTQVTAIDGEGGTTLEGDGTRPLFTNSATLTLSNVTVRNPLPPGGAATTMIVYGGRVELNKVRTEKTSGPYVATTFSATDSVFEDNGDPTGEGFRAIVEADTITLLRATFTKNGDHAIGGGANPAAGRPPASRSIVIEDSAFSENRLPLLVFDASLTIRRTTFTANGQRLPDTERVWGCCAGALTIVHAVATIEDSTFTGNSSPGFGGAVQALSSRVSIRRTLFENNSARVGGAVMSWGRPATTNIWSSGALPVPPGLTLERVRFHGNTASETGGALAWSGEVGGDAAIFGGNRARRGGAMAHWTADVLNGEFADVFGALTSATQAAPETLGLTRGVFVDNTATEQGAALDGGDAGVVLGNALVARNRLTGGAGGALAGAEIRLVNTTVVGNGTEGVTPGARGLTLANSIVADNERGNCAAGPIVTDPNSIQFPGTSCGAARSIGAGLDEKYSPTLLSPARYTGDVSTCIGDPLVGGRDLHGVGRGEQGTCAVGAIEPQLDEDLFSGTPFGSSPAPWWWLLLLLLLFLLIGLWIGLVRGRKRAYRRRAQALPQM
jgi:hypothetical protein